MAVRELDRQFPAGEDVIPEMFQNVLKSVENQFPGKLAHFTYYLERHIQEDADRHGPMAIRMLVRLCGGSPEKWQEALEAARIAGCGSTKDDPGAQDVCGGADKLNL